MSLLQPNNILQINQPFNIIVFLCFFSPIIVAMGITSLSFWFQNFKGFIYLGFLIACCVLRSYIYEMSKGIPLVYDSTICTSIQYSKYGNATFSAFVFAFTIMYLSIPMFTNGNPNFWIFSGFVLYAGIDIFIKIYKKCVINTTDLFINILSGMAISAIIVSAMYAGGSGKYLFFNEVSSNTDVCYQPKQQTFKCSMYKNGELISGIPTI